MTNCQVLNRVLSCFQKQVLIFSVLCFVKMAGKYNIFTLQVKNAFNGLFV